ncbi:MAG TPA: cupredoxin domain-containing protein [Gaiella sp.]|jgi:plastocyanin|nr:cupredoxin domain-containing protein [Gaiella sp.]
MPLAIALGLTALASSGAFGSTTEAPTRAVSMPGKAYDPAHLDVLVGTTVTWKNDDSINHTVTADGDAFSSGYVPPGGSFSFAFAKQGRYAFHCTIHTFMRGEVDVFGLVLTGPEGPVSAGRRVVFAGLAPAGTASVALRGPSGQIVVHPRPDGSFAVRTTVAVPASYRAVAGSLVSPAVHVQVRPLVRATSAGDRVRATVSPRRAGATAVLQAYDREHFAWKNVAHEKLDAASRVALRVPHGVVRARVLVVGTHGWAAGVSQPLVLRHGGE